MAIPYEVNYLNRQVDMELLQSIAQPVEIQRVHANFIFGPAKIVTGIQKAVQRYALLLLTEIGDVHFDATQGVSFLRPILGGNIQNRGRFQNLFAVANAEVRTQLNSEDAKIDTYGSIPDDERIVNSQLLDFDINFETATVTLRVAITTAAGDSFTFIVPVTVPR